MHVHLNVYVARPKQNTVDSTKCAFATVCSLTDRIASVEAALSSLSSSSASIITPDTGRDATRPTSVTYNFIGNDDTAA